MKRFTACLPLRILSLLLGWAILSCGSCLAISAVPTQNNDNARTGSNPNEIYLTPRNVKTATFGKLFALHLDANVNGQVLYAPGVTIGGTAHNVLYLATSNNSNGSPSSAYAFDADSSNGSGPLWRHVFPKSAQWTTCAPALDLDAGILYVLTKDSNDSGPTKLHALDMKSGNEMPGSPVVIQASLPGTGDGSKNGVVSFDPSHANCRPGLLVSKGIVYFGFAHNSDSFPYHGWVFGYQYDGAAFAQAAVFCASPNGGLDGIWQAGKGIAADADGNLYFSTGNGTFDANRGGSGYGMCYMKLDPDLKVLDWYAPYDERAQSDVDNDLGNSGPLLLPGTNRLFAGATKFGSGFLLDATHLGGFHPEVSDGALQRIDDLSSNDNVGQNPVAWDAGASDFIYLWPSGSPVVQLRYDKTADRIAPAGAYKRSAGSTSGGSLAVTSNGTADGLLWAAGNDGVLRAYDATDVSLPEIWDSRMNASRDELGSVGHFQFPMAANGGVYVPTGDATVAVYGLLPSAAIPGDMNGDGQVKIGDVVLSLQIATGLFLPTAYQKKAGDLNGDGSLTIEDAILGLRKAAGL